MPTKNDEYKALRDEIVSLFHRIFVTLSAVFAASALLSRSVLQDGSPPGGQPARLYLSWVNAAVVSAGIVIAIKFYDHISRISAYIAVYLEEDKAGWHCWNANVPKVIRPRGRWIAQFSEPEVVAAAYFLLAVNAVVLVVLRTASPAGAGALAPVVVLGGWFVLILINLASSYGARQNDWKTSWRMFFKCMQLVAGTQKPADMCRSAGAPEATATTPTPVESPPSQVTTRAPGQEAERTGHGVEPKVDKT